MPHITNELPLLLGAVSGDWNSPPPPSISPGFFVPAACRGTRNRLNLPDTYVLLPASFFHLRIFARVCYVHVMTDAGANKLAFCTSVKTFPLLFALDRSLPFVPCGARIIGGESVLLRHGPNHPEEN